MTVYRIVYMTEPYYLFNVDVVLESLILWPKFQQLINLLKMYVCVV